jgi:hypothetical protein
MNSLYYGYIAQAYFLWIMKCNLNKLQIVLRLQLRLLARLRLPQLVIYLSLYTISMISNLSDLSLPNARAQDQSVATRPVYVSISLYVHDLHMISNLNDLSLPNARAQDQSLAARPVCVSVSLYI